MRLDSEGLRELYQRETTRSARGSVTGCLTEDALARAAAGELDQPERERTADHLASCSDCANEYRAITSLRQWADNAAASTGARIMPMVSSGNGQGQSSSASTLGETQVGSRRVSFYLPYAIAAASLILSLALGALLLEANKRQSMQSAENAKTAEALAESRRKLEETNRRIEQENAARRVAEEQLAKREEELARRNAADHDSNRAPEATATTRDTSPDVNVPIIDLNPQDAGRGEQNQNATTIHLPAYTDLFTLILNLRGDDASRSYSLEITDRRNRTIWTNRNLRKSPYNNFTVAIRRRSLPPGEYRLKIYGLRDGRRELIEEYAIRLVY
jgi:hypothetical protein